MTQKGHDGARARQGRRVPLQTLNFILVGSSAPARSNTHGDNTFSAGRPNAVTFSVASCVAGATLPTPPRDTGWPRLARLPMPPVATLLRRRGAARRLRASGRRPRAPSWGLLLWCRRLGRRTRRRRISEAGPCRRVQPRASSRPWARQAPRPSRHLPTRGRGAPKRHARRPPPRHSSARLRKPPL